MDGGPIIGELNEMCSREEVRNKSTHMETGPARVRRCHFRDENRTK